MLLRNRFRIVLALAACAVVSLIATPVWADLQNYVRRPESEYEWKLRNKIDNEQSGEQIYDLQFVSQVWQENKWQHQL